MSNLSTGKLPAEMSFCHKLINKLTIIIGNCDLLREGAERAEGWDVRSLQRLDVIRNIADALADEVKEHELELDKIPAALGPSLLTTDSAFVAGTVGDKSPAREARKAAAQHHVCPHLLARSPARPIRH